MKFFVLLTALVLASKNENVESAAANLEENIMKVENLIVVKIEEDDYAKKERKTSNYIGVSYSIARSKWMAQRWGKTEKKQTHNGYYKDEETAAHASDNLARKLMANGEQGHKLNFPDDNTEVHPDKNAKSSKFSGVYYIEKYDRWLAQRWSKTDNKRFNNGYHAIEETAAHASDTLARKFIANGEQGHKLNFPDDDTEVFAKQKIRNSKCFGVSYQKKFKKWLAQRWSKSEKKVVQSGWHKDEETAAHASDTLARKLMANGEQNHKLNFRDGKTEEHAQQQTNKRKRSFNFETSQTDENNLEK